MKKKTIRAWIIVGISTLLVFVIGTLYFTIPYCVFKESESIAVCDKDVGVIRVEGNSLKILQITDLHVNGALDMPLTFDVIKALVNRSEPDLIIVTGDIFSNGCSEDDVDTFVDFMGRLGLPWASILGNHDDETPYSLEELSAILASAKNSLFKRGDLTDLYGNYFYNVKFADGEEYKFIFMDSRSRGFTDESVEFYTNAVQSSSADGGTVAESFLFFHIPLPETVEAIDEYMNGRADGTGDIRETICNQKTDVGFFEKVVELGSTKAMIYGHDHYNDAKTNYLGVDFNYGTKTGTSAGNMIGLVGGTVYTLNSNGEYSVQDIIIL